MGGFRGWKNSRQYFQKIKDKFGMLILRKKNIFEKKKEISRGRSEEAY